jgi:hypothetical protein
MSVHLLPTDISREYEFSHFYESVRINFMDEGCLRRIEDIFKPNTETVTEHDE